MPNQAPVDRSRFRDSKFMTRPGQIEPNELEIAILDRIAQEHPSVRPFLRRLHVLSRKYTGVGSFTNFRCDDVAEDAPREDLSLNGLIVIPTVPNGLGAVLFCRDGKPECLETFTYGDDHWDGVCEGFSIERAG